MLALKTILDFSAIDVQDFEMLGHRMVSSVSATTWIAAFTSVRRGMSSLNRKESAGGLLTGGYGDGQVVRVHVSQQITARHYGIVP